MQINLKHYKTKIYNYPCESPTICHPEHVILYPGTYIIQCFGASGGDSGKGKGGYGAHVAGIIHFDKVIDLYLFIGAKGHLNLGNDTYNGGGRGHLYISDESQGASGGGATDVRLYNKTDTEGLLSRIIVAGGGAGAESYNTVGGKGGDAGGLVAQDGVKISKGTQNLITVGKGGSQTAGGEGGKCLRDTNSDTCESNKHGHDGSFGIGGSGSDFKYGSGGGGGYFGGGGGSIAGSIVSTGGGGSSYMSGFEDCHSFKLDSSNELFDINSSYHPLGYVFTPLIFQNGTEAKYVGNGKIIITLIGQIITCKYKISISKIYLIISLLIFDK